MTDFWQLLLPSDANRETMGAGLLWWWWIGQVPGGRRCREHISHNLLHKCSWVFCEISTMTQESQEKLRGKERPGKAQEVASSYSWILPVLMERSVMGDTSPWCWVASATRKDQAAAAWAAGKYVVVSNCISTCRKGELCSLPISGMVGTSLWQWVVTVTVAAPTALLPPPLAITVAEGTHVALRSSLPFSLASAALEIPHPSPCYPCAGKHCQLKEACRKVRCKALCYLVLINKAKMWLFDSTCNFDYCNGVPFLWMQYASVPH